MIAVLRMPEATYLMQIFASAFLAILFLQSGIDKVVDRRGNFEWLKGHFAKSPLAGIVPVLLGAITILELAAGILSAVGCVADHPFARFNRSILRRGHFCDRNRRAILWPAHGQRIRRSGGACSVLSVHVGCDLSARTGLIENPHSFSRNRLSLGPWRVEALICSA